MKGGFFGRPYTRMSGVVYVAFMTIVELVDDFIRECTAPVDWSEAIGPKNGARATELLRAFRRWEWNLYRGTIRTTRKEFVDILASKGIRPVEQNSGRYYPLSLSSSARPVIKP